jgi:hypothetical protein
MCSWLQARRPKIQKTRRYPMPSGTSGCPTPMSKTSVAVTIRRLRKIRLFSVRASPASEPTGNYCAFGTVYNVGILKEQPLGSTNRIPPVFSSLAICSPDSQ